MIYALAELFIMRGTPVHVRLDNEAAFAAVAMKG